MTDENMALYQENRWYDFWTNLKEGYDYFEIEHTPPKIKVENRQYIIGE
jgi:murein L,D-transpeptidase YafK